MSSAVHCAGCEGERTTACPTCLGGTKPCPGIEAPPDLFGAWKRAVGRGWAVDWQGLDESPDSNCFVLEYASAETDWVKKVVTGPAEAVEFLDSLGKADV